MSLGQIFLYALLALLAFGVYAMRARIASFIEKSRVFLREVQLEMKKVSWPSKDELIGNTFIVIVAAAVLALLIFSVDSVLAKVVQFVFLHGPGD